jgi:energy-coupling factor transport system permease protein
MKTTLYVDRASAIHRLHPTVKISGLFAIFWSIYWIDNPWALLVLAALVAMLAGVVGAGENVWRLRWFLILIIVPTTITWMIFYRVGTPIVNLPVVHVSRASIMFGVGRGLKVGALVLASVLFLSSTKVEELAVGLGRIGLPYRLGFAVTLAFRLVPLFIESALTVVDAQRLRGYEFNVGGPVARVRRYVPVVIPVFMGALRKANNMAMALEARGFGRTGAHTSLIEYRFHGRDLVAFGFVAALAAAAFMVYYTGLGAIPTT